MWKRGGSRSHSRTSPRGRARDEQAKLVFEEIREPLGGEQKEHMWVLNAEAITCLDDEEEMTDTRESPGAMAMISSVTSDRKGKEMRKKDMSSEDKKGFQVSDRAEWESLIKTGAVRVLTGKRARRARPLHPERIMKSRFVRVKKPEKYKSRWCVWASATPT